MKIPLNLPRNSAQQDFLDFLNSELRARMLSFSGSAGFDDEVFHSTVSGPFSLDQDSVHLSWRLEKDLDGTLLSIRVAAEDSSDSSSAWETAARELVTSVLAATLADTRKKYFRRSLFFYIGPQLDGEYWLPTYRFAPAYPDDPDPYLINAERVVSIDQEVEAIDKIHAIAIADEASRRHAARLTLLLNTALYRGDNNHRWVYPITDGGKVEKSERYQLAFVHPDIHLAEMPKKGVQCTLGKYEGSLAARYRVAGDLLSLPPEARRVLRNVDAAEPRVSNAFDCGARLYQVAAVCGAYFPSVGLAYRVAAVDAVRQADGSCGSFSEFMRKHVANQPNLEEILEYLFSTVRSAHFHGGQFPVGEYGRQFTFDPFMNAEAVQRDALHRTCHELTREAIVSWINQSISVVDVVRNNENGA